MFGVPNRIFGTPGHSFLYPIKPRRIPFPTYIQLSVSNILADYENRRTPV
jgi:hypothetical protein